MRVFMSFATVALLAAVISVEAQEAIKPGPEHDKLKGHVGTWDAVAEYGDKSSKGVLTARMALGNLWLIEDYQGDLDGVKFEGHGMTTYDAKKKKYINVWTDSMSTEPMLTEGVYEKGDRLVLKGKMPMPDGSYVDGSMTSHHKDANTIVFTVEGTGPDGKSMEFIKITYKKRK